MINETIDGELVRLGQRLNDEFSTLLLAGAERVGMDSENPIRGNLFAAAIRELFTHTFHRLAPDEQVTACSWFMPDPQVKDGRPTRRQRCSYIIHGGLSESYVKTELKLDTGSLLTKLTRTYEKLNKATHLKEGSVINKVADLTELTRTVSVNFTAFLDTIDECRALVSAAVFELVDYEANEEVWRETIQAIDTKSTHHMIEEVYIDSVKVAKIDADYVWYKASGTISAELQFGSNSDLRNDMGAIIPHDFPFDYDVPAPVDDPTTLDTSLAELHVEDGGWNDDHRYEPD